MPRVDLSPQLSNELKELWNNEHPYWNSSLTQIITIVVEKYIKKRKHNG